MSLLLHQLTKEGHFGGKRKEKEENGFFLHKNSLFFETTVLSYKPISSSVYSLIPGLLASDFHLYLGSLILIQHRIFLFHCRDAHQTFSFAHTSLPHFR